MKEENKIIIEDNYGDFGKEAPEGKRLANLLIGGKENDCPRLLLPCLRGMQGKRIKRLTLEFEESITIEKSKNQGPTGGHLLWLSHGNKWSKKKTEEMGDSAPLVLLGILHEPTKEENATFYKLLEENRDKIDEHMVGDYTEEDILNDEAFKDIKEREVFMYVIKKVIDEARPVQEQICSEKKIEEAIESTKGDTEAYDKGGSAKSRGKPGTRVVKY